MTVGHNNPPDPIDEITSQHEGVIMEAEGWLDGKEVEDEGQMKAVDVLTKDIKAALKDINAGEKSASAPLHDKWKAEKARWKPTIDDVTRIRDGLVAINAPFKKRLADEKEAERRRQWQKAEDARIAAEQAEAEAQAGDIEQQREAQAVKQGAIDAEIAAKQAQKDTVKGMRKVHKYDIVDHKAALHWIAINDKSAMTEFITEYVRRNHKVKDIDGVNQTIEKEAF